MSSNTKEVHSSECIQTVQLKKASLPLVYTKRVQQKLKRSLTLHGTRLSMRKMREKSVFSSRKLKLVLQWEFHSICLLTITVRAAVCLNFTRRHYLSYMSSFQLSLTVSYLAPQSVLHSNPNLLIPFWANDCLRSVETLDTRFYWCRISNRILPQLQAVRCQGLQKFQWQFFSNILLQHQSSLQNMQLQLVLQLICWIVFGVEIIQNHGAGQPGKTLFKTAHTDAKAAVTLMNAAPMKEH